MSKIHYSVLLEEAVNNIVMNKSGIYIDGTIGFGGHAQAILSKLDSKGKLIGIDLDPYALEYTKNSLSKFPKKSYSLYKGNFSEFPKFINEMGISKVDGLVVDLGISSYQIDSGHRGFSYMNDGPLDMRFNSDKGISAKNLLNNISYLELSNLIREFSEEKNHKKIAKNIVKYSELGKMNTTFDLKNAIKEVVNPRYLNKTLSRVFQAIRIQINDELNSLKKLLANAVQYLQKGGRIAIITFHSLEDSIVKSFFKKNSINCICPPVFPICNCDVRAKLKIINKKVISPSLDEINKNPRSRSAKLRIAECL